MALGKRRGGIQGEMFIYSQALQSSSNAFYEALESVLCTHNFDRYVEGICAEFYAARMGRPGLAPGVYFRMLVIGYMEGWGSEREIAWRCNDSISLRRFLGYSVTEHPPDHRTLSKTRRRLSVEVHMKVFVWVLARLKDAGVLRGKTLGIDATTLEANAAMRSIVRRDTGQAYDVFLESLARESGIQTPTRADLVKLDKNRPNKGSNQDWMHPNDPDARITKMKDGRTHLAHKCEHAVDLDSGALVAVTVQTMDGGDTASIEETLDVATQHLDAVELSASEVVTDKGDHSNAVMASVQARGLRSYISEPNRGRRKWSTAKPAQQPTYANRRRIKGTRGKSLLRQRAENVERAFAHLLETGGFRRVHVRGQLEISKRIVLQDLIAGRFWLVCATLALNYLLTNQEPSYAKLHQSIHFCIIDFCWDGCA